MLSFLPRLVGVTSFVRLLARFLRVFCAFLRVFARGSETKTKQKQKKLHTGQFSYSAAISACKNCKQWETALELLDDMTERGMERDMHSLNAAVAACASAGRWDMLCLRGKKRGAGWGGGGMGVGVAEMRG